MTETNISVDQTPVVDIPAATEVPTQEVVKPMEPVVIPAAKPTTLEMVASDEVPEAGAPEPQTVQPEEGTQTFSAEPARDITAHRDQESGEFPAKTS